MLNIYIDFDGTITRQDVGDAMFEHFGGAQCAETIKEYRSEKISAVECFRRECAACGAIRQAELDEFLDTCEIDQTFPSFVAFCRSAGFNLTVLSDGMDYYIRRILGRHGLSDVSFRSNHLRLVPSDGGTVSLAPEFPFTDEVCDRCASCKRNHILSTSGDDDIIAYVGEGYSDRCPARYADIVFAKDELLGYCREEGIPCVEYATFADIRLHFESPRSRRWMRKRRQAELARREVFLGG